MKSNQFELKIDAKLENISAIADFIATTMNRLGITGNVFEVQTAVDEACSNIIKHAYLEGKGSITISCKLQGDDFMVTIVDKGRPFDPSSVPPPDLESDLDERRIGGLGIHLMRKLMDDVNYSFDAEKGNKLIMRKRLTHQQQES